MKVSLDKAARSALIVPVGVRGPEQSFCWKLVGAIDTGASMVVLPRLAAEVLGYELDSAPEERFVVAGGALRAPKILLHRVAIEGASADGVEAICLDLPDECPIECVVGLSFLTRFKVAFDFDAWEMELVPSA